MFLVRLLIGEPSKRQRLIWSSSEKIIETCLRLKIRQCVYRISAKESCKLNSYHCCELHFFVNKAFAATLLQLRSVFHSCNFPWRKPKDVVPPPVGFLLMKIASRSRWNVFPSVPDGLFSFQHFRTRNSWVRDGPNFQNKELKSTRALKN